MCYSAMVNQDLKSLARKFKAAVDYAAFEEIFRRRGEDDRIKLGRALEANFRDPQTAAERRIADSIRAFREQQAQKWEAELFRQRKRLADAERKLAQRETHTAREERRIAGNKVEWHLGKLADLRRTESAPDDSRIFPFWFAPLVVYEGGEYVIRPMRYHCRPAGKPAGFDHRYPGLYNARRDSLDGFWKNLFGRHHAVCVVTSFFENVARHDFEHRALRPGEPEQNLVLHFNPTPATEMVIACLWDRWQPPGQPAALESFAAITDEPPPEIAATGHNRCIVPLQPAAVTAWLDPQHQEPASLQQLLDRRERPYYAYELAA